MSLVRAFFRASRSMAAFSSRGTFVMNARAMPQAVGFTVQRGFASGEEPFVPASVATERIIEVVKNFEKVDASKVTPTASFKEDLDLDSLDGVEVVMAIEEEFCIEIPDSEADKIQSVADAVSYICAHPMANKMETQLTRLTHQLRSSSLSSRMSALEDISLFILGEDDESKPVAMRRAIETMLMSFLDGYFQEGVWREGIVGAVCCASNNSPVNVFTIAMDIIESLAKAKASRSIAVLANTTELAVCVLGCLQSTQDDALKDRLRAIINIHGELLNDVALREVKSLPKSKVLKRCRSALMNLLKSCPDYIPLYVMAWPQLKTCDMCVGLLGGWLRQNGDFRTIDLGAFQASLAPIFAKEVLCAKSTPSANHLEAYAPALKDLAHDVYKEYIEPALVRSLKRACESAAASIAQVIALLPESTGTNAPDLSQFLLESVNPLMRVLSSKTPAVQRSGLLIIKEALCRVGPTSDLAPFVVALSEGTCKPKTTAESDLKMLALAHTAVSLTSTVSNKLIEDVLTAVLGAAKKLSGDAKEEAYYAAGQWLVQLARTSASGCSLSSDLVQLLLAGISGVDKGGLSGVAVCISTAHASSTKYGAATAALWGMLAAEVVPRLAPLVMSSAGEGKTPCSFALRARIILIHALLGGYECTDGAVRDAIDAALGLGTDTSAMTHVWDLLSTDCTLYKEKYAWSWINASIRGGATVTSTSSSSYPAFPNALLCISPVLTMLAARAPDRAIDLTSAASIPLVASLLHTSREVSARAAALLQSLLTALEAPVAAQLVGGLIQRLYTWSNDVTLCPEAVDVPDKRGKGLVVFSGKQLSGALLSLLPGKDVALPLSPTAIATLMLLCAHPSIAHSGETHSSRLWRGVRSRFDLGAAIDSGLIGRPKVATEMSHIILEAIFGKAETVAVGGGGDADGQTNISRARSSAAGCGAVALIDEAMENMPNHARLVFATTQRTVFEQLLQALEDEDLAEISREEAQVWRSPETALTAALSTSAVVTDDDVRLTNADRKKDGGKSTRKGGFESDLADDEDWAEQMMAEKRAKLQEARDQMRKEKLDIAMEESREMRARVGMLVARGRAAFEVISEMARRLVAAVASEISRVVAIMVAFMDDSRPLLHAEAMKCLQACVSFCLNDPTAVFSVSHGIRAISVTIYRHQFPGERPSEQLATLANFSQVVSRALNALKTCAASTHGQGLPAPAMNLALPLVHATLVAATAPATPAAVRPHLPDHALAFSVLEGLWNQKLEASLLAARPLLIECCLRALSKVGKSGSLNGMTGPEPMMNRLAAGHRMSAQDWHPILSELGVRSTSGAVRNACYGLMERCAAQGAKTEESVPLQLVTSALWVGQFDNLDYVRATAISASERWGLPTIAEPWPNPHALPPNFHHTLLRMIAPRFFEERSERLKIYAALSAGGCDSEAQKKPVDVNSDVADKGVQSALSLRAHRLCAAPAPLLGGRGGAKAAAAVAAASASAIAKVAGKALAAGVLTRGMAQARDEAVTTLMEIFEESLPEAAAQAAREVSSAMGKSGKVSKELAAAHLAAQNRLAVRGGEDVFLRERLLVAYSFASFPPPVDNNSSGATTSGKNDKIKVKKAKEKAIDSGAEASWVLPLLKFITERGAVDDNAAVRQAMLEAGSKLVYDYGGLACNDMLSLFQTLLAQEPDANAGDKALSYHDRRHEAAVILLGSAGSHLEHDDPKLLEITQTMVDALRTPAENVQVAVADALVGLVRVLRRQSSQSVMLADLFESLMVQAISGESYGDRRGAAYGAASLVRALGPKTLAQYDVIPRMQEQVTTGNINARQGGLFVLESLSARMGLLFEPYIITFMPVLIKSFSHGSDHVRESARGAAKAIFAKISAHGIKQVLPPILEGLESDTQWKSRQEAVRLLGTMAHCAPRQLAQALPQVVPRLMECCSDPHPKVKDAAKVSMSDISGVVKNPEVAGLSGELLAALGDPAKHTGKALDALLTCEFMHAIDAPSLGLLVPILGRGLRDRSAEIKRRACLITANITQMVNDSRLLVPYLPQILPGLRENVIDPIPDVRTHAASCMGAIAAGVGEKELGDTLPWLLKTATGAADVAATAGKSSEAEGAVERSGAAQTLAELCKSLGRARTEQLVATLMPAQRSKRAAAREGLLWMLSFLPLSIGEQFAEYMDGALPVVLAGLADDVENVREVAMRAGQITVSSLGHSHCRKLVPSLAEGMFSPKWRIRHSSLLLLGDLLILVGEATAADRALCSGDGIMVSSSSSKGGVAVATAKGESEVDGDDDDDSDDDDDDDVRIASTGTVGKLRAHMGKHNADSALAAIYVLRNDVSLTVRQSASNVWKQVVSNTPRLLSEIMDQLVGRLVVLLASTETDLATIGGKTLGETARRLGNRVLPAVVPHLQRGLASSNDGERRSACVGLAEIISASEARQIEMYASTLVPALIAALCDEDAAVRQLATSAFATMLRTVGISSIKRVIPSLLRSLEDALAGADDEAALEAALSVRNGSDSFGIEGGSTTAGASAVRRALLGLCAAVATRPRDVVAFLLDYVETHTAIDATDEVAEFDGETPLSRTGCYVIMTLGVTGAQQLALHLGKIAPLLCRSHASSSHGGCTDKQMASTAVVSATAAAVCGAVEDGGVSNMIDEISKTVENELAVHRRLGCWLAQHFVAECQADYSEFTPLLFRYLLGRCCDRDDSVLAAALSALQALGKAQPHDALIMHVDFIRSCLNSTISDARHRTDAQGRHPDLQETSFGGCTAPMFCRPKSLDPLLAIFTHGLLKGSPNQKESCALAMGELIAATSDTVLKPYLIKAVGPFIRVMGERVGSPVKAALLETLEVLLRRGGIALKPFVPQLQTTFLKALSDATKQVRTFAGKCLAALMPLTARVDAVLTEVSTVCASAEAAAIRATAVGAIATILSRPEAQEKVSQAVLCTVARSLQGLTVSDEDATRSAACAAIRQVAAGLQDDEVFAIVGRATATQDKDDSYKEIEGRLLACGGALGASGILYRANNDDDGDSHGASTRGTVSSFVALVEGAFQHWSPNAHAAACRAIGLALSPANRGASKRPSDVDATIMKLAVTRLVMPLQDKTPEVKEDALYAVKQLGKHTSDEQTVTAAGTLVPPVLAILRTGDPRLKGPAERAARHMLLAKATPDLSRETPGVDDNIAKFAKKAKSEDQSFVREYAKRHLLQQLNDSDDEG